MKLGDFKDVDVESTEELSSIDFSMDMESMGILFKGFSDNLYSNKIGSIVREIASNCFDANAESGYTGAVKIRIMDPVGGRSGEIQFEDNGPGLSPDRVQNVYAKYFASTKRNSNNEIGGFGIGAKSPFAYTDTFQVITWVDGTEYHYLMHRGVSAPQIKLVYQADTDLPNGTRVCIPIKSSTDADKFRKEIRDQLRYFDNIDYENCGVNNDYQIIRFGPMIFRSGDVASEISLCIGKVRYPLDKYQLRSEFLTATSTNFSLYFDIGELSVTMNREQIDYNDETIAKIEERYAEARKFLMDYYTELMETNISLLQYISLKEQGNASITFTIDDVKHVGYTKGIVDNPYKNIQHPAFLAYPELTINSKTMNAFCDVVQIVNGKRKAFQMTRRGYRANPAIANLPMKQRYANVYDVLNSMNEANACPVYRSKGDEKLTEMKMSYIHEEEDHEALVILQLKPEFTSSNSFYGDGFSLVTSRADETANTMEGYRKLRKMALSEMVTMTKSYDKLQVPEKYVTDWKNSRRKIVARILQDEEIIARAPTYGYRNEGTVDFTKVVTSLRLMHEYDKKGVILVYGNNNDTAMLIEAFRLISIFQGGPRPLTGRNAPWYEGGGKLQRGQRLVLKIASNNTRSIEAHFKNAVYVKDFLDKADKLYARYLLAAKLGIRQIPSFVFSRLHSKEGELFNYIGNIQRSPAEENGYPISITRGLWYRNPADFETYPIYISSKARVKHHRVSTVGEIIHNWEMVNRLQDYMYKETSSYITTKAALALGFMPDFKILKESKIKRQSRWSKQSTDSAPENQSVSATEE
jgi:hypothetical protein